MPQLLTRIFGNQTDPDPDAAAAAEAKANLTSLTEPFPAGIEVWIDHADAYVDICFIHGLTGNRNTTWTATGQTKPWPQSLLPIRLKNLKARIFTYGYDAYIVRWGQPSDNRLIDHANNFLQDVVGNRASCGISDRPLIIVAHSLGGLITKQALLMSRNSAEARHEQLYNSTIGIMFMGTPHTGSWVADWSKIPLKSFGIMKSANTDLLKALQTNDQLLEGINQSFLQLLRRLRERPLDGKKLLVTCFFEELGYPGIGKKVVPKASATFASDLPISIHANHQQMVRFATVEDGGFVRFAEELDRYIKEIR